MFLHCFALPFSVHLSCGRTEPGGSLPVTVPHSSHTAANSGGSITSAGSYPQPPPPSAQATHLPAPPTWCFLTLFLASPELICGRQNQGLPRLWNILSTLNFAIILDQSAVLLMISVTVTRKNDSRPVTEQETEHQATNSFRESSAKRCFLPVHSSYSWGFFSFSPPSSPLLAQQAFLLTPLLLSTHSTFSDVLLRSANNTGCIN